MFTEENFLKVKDFFKKKDHKIYEIFEKHGYLKPLPQRNLFSHLIGAIIGQRIRFTQARKLRGKLYTELGTDNFTPIDLLQNLGYSGLIEIGIDPQPAKIINDTALHCLSNPLKTMEDVKKLRNLSGIGPWTINTCLLMYTLQENNEEFLDYLLIEDLIIRRGLKKLYGDLSNKEIREKAVEWSPYQGIVTWYLWKEYT